MTELKARMATPAEQIAAISQWVDDSYPADIDPELALRRRTDKVGVENGELLDAIEGYTGENPRKGAYKTRDDVLYELLDVAIAALAAYEHMTGNHGTSAAALAAHVDNQVRRIGLPFLVVDTDG